MSPDAAPSKTADVRTHTLSAYDYLTRA